MLKRLVYVSVATSLHDDAALNAILQSSRRNNARDGLTGLLLYEGGHFMQAVEGEDDALQAMMVRVNSDSRHYGLRVTHDIAVPKRMFGGWSMACGHLTEDDLTRLLAGLGEEKNLTSAMLRVFMRTMMM